MSFRRSDLQEAFFVPGTHAFRVWGYGTTGVMHLTHPDHDVESARRDRPDVGADIKVTPEMIEAGVDVMSPFFSSGYDSIEDVTRWVYEAMEEARRSANRENQ